MIYIVYVFAFLGVLFLIITFWLGKIVTKAKKELRDKPRTFKDGADLMGFIRNVYECKIKHRIVMYGFVESVVYDESLVLAGASSDPCLSVDVILITNNGTQKVNTTCGQIQANLKRGDFVAVLPFHNERHDLWYYVAIAKLKTTYLGLDGFPIEEEYTN
jgi:hypothetical protein